MPKSLEQIGVNVGLVDFGSSIGLSVLIGPILPLDGLAHSLVTLKVSIQYDVFKVYTAFISFPDEEVDFSLYKDHKIITGVLKQYLRELPQPVISFDAYSQIMKATGVF